MLRYAAKSKFDLISGQKEIDDLEAERQKILDEKKSRNAGANGRPYAVGQQDAPDFDSFTTGYGITNNRPYAAGLQVQKEETPEDTRLREIDQLISKKKQYLNQAKRIQESEAYANTVKNVDFDRFDDYVKSDDALYNWINDEQFRDSYESNYVNPQQGSVGGSQNHNAQIPAPLKSEFARKGYDRMNANEIAIYNYYHAKGGKEAAQKYLDNIQETLERRVAVDMYGGIKDSTAAKIVFGAAVGLNQFGSNVKNFFNTEDDYIAQTAYQLAGDMVREDLADEGKKIGLLGGVSLGQIAYDTVSTTANMAPSILASYAVGAAAGTLGLSAKTAQAVGSYTGSAMMGVSAAGGAYQQALNEGYDKNQARGYSMLVGASEMAMEKLLGGISAVGGNALGRNAVKNIANADNALKAIAKRIGGSALSEFGEEYLQEVLDPVFSNIMLKTDKEVKPISAEAIYSGILGMLTGAIMEAPSAIYGETKTAITGRKIKKAGGADSLAKIGNTFAPDTVAYKLAGKVNENTGAYTIGKLFNEIGASLTQQNVNDISEALMKEGIGEIAAKKYAQAFAYVVEGGAMPDSLVNAIEADTVLAKAAREVLIDSNTTWNQRTQGYNEVLKKLAMDKVTGKTAPTSKAGAPTDNTAEAKTESGAKGNVEPAKYGSIQTIKNGKVTVKMTDGTEVDLKDANLDPDDSVRIETIASIDGISAEDASGIFNILNAGSKNSQYDAIGAREAYRYGYYGLTENHLNENGTFSKALTPEQRKAVYEMGRKARDTSVTAETGKIKQMREAAAQKEPAKLRITYNQGNGVVQDIESKTITGLSRKQRAAVSFAKVLHKLGVGTDFEFFESYLSKTQKDKNGNRARVFLDDNGQEVSAYSGVYQTADGKIRIDLNAYSGRGLALNAMSHELVHFIKQWSPDRYRTMADIVGNAYGNTQMSMHHRVLREQARLKRIRGTEVSYDEAYDEVVANALNRMLDDGTVLDRIAEIRKVDGGLADKMVDCIRKFIKRFAKVFSDNESLFYDTEDLMQFKDTVDELRGMFAEALVEASDNRLSSVETEAVESLGENATVETNSDGQLLRMQYSSQETDRDRQQYNAFREKFAKERLDSLSDKLGRLFPLSAGFEQAIQKDQTPVSNMTVVANGLKRGNGESYYTAGKNAFRNVYGGRTTFSIKQLGISAEADDNFARESMSKVSDTKDLQTLLDLTPYFKQLIEGSRLLSVERTLHNDNKKTSLLCYRLYNAYVRKEDYINENGSKQTHNVPHIVVFNVVQNLNDAKAHMVTDIKDVAVSNGHNSSKLKYATHANGNIHIDNIADVYDVVKSIDRKKGGLRYSATDDLKYKFDYSQKNSGELYSTQETDNITARDLLSSTDVATIKNEVVKKKLSDYQKILEVKNAEDQKLREIRAEIKELSFAKAPKDTKKLKDLKFEAIKINNHISVYEGQLQRMEKELQSVVKRERAKVVKEAEKRDKAVLAKEWMDAQVKQNELLREYREIEAAAKQQESDASIMEKEFIRIVKEYEKLDAKRGKTISGLRQKLREAAESHRADQKMWMTEFRRLMREYDAAERNIDRLEQKIIRQRASAKERVQNRNKTAMRHKIRKTIRELDKLLNRGSKERNVKEGMRDFVAEALASAEVLFIDDYSNEDIIRNGVGCDTEPWESKLIDETQVLMQRKKDLYIKSAAMHEVDDVIAGNTASFDARQKEADKLDRKIAENMRQLSGVFARERARLNRYTVSSVLENLAKAYKSLGQSDDLYIRAATDEVVYQHLLSLSEQMYGATVKDMTLKQLKELDKAYTMVLTTVQNANKVFREGRAQQLSQIVRLVQSQIQSISASEKDPTAAKEKIAKWIRSFFWNELRPVDAFERLGSDSFTELFWDVIDAQGEYGKLVRECADMVTKARKTANYAKWDMKSATTFKTVDGKEFKLTLGDLMSVYAYSKREQAYDHMTEGGFTFDTGRTYKSKENGKTYVHKKLSSTYRISEENLNRIISSLTAEQRKYVDTMQKFLTEFAKHGNKASRTLYGIDLFTEENYFPLFSEQDFRNSTEQDLNNTQTMVSLKESGMTKQTKPGANNPIVLRAFDDVVLEHLDKMAKYATYVLPIENLQRVFNSVGKDGENNTSTKALISSVFGEEATTYFKNYITDLNGGKQATGAANPLADMFAKSKATAVSANLSVVIQQPTSIIRSMNEIDLKYFIPLSTKGNAKNNGKLYDEMMKYAPVAVIKDMGGFDVGSSSGLKGYIGTEETAWDAEKAWKAAQDFFGWGAMQMDRIGWTVIWIAVKRETLKKTGLQYGSQAYLEACGKRFTEVVTKTQVYDSVNSRSGFMRSKNDSLKYLTTFMGEPTVTAGMTYMSHLKLYRAVKSKNKTQIAKATREWIRTDAVLVVTALVCGFAKSFVYAMRDDDEDESFMERWLKHFGSAIASDRSFLGLLPVFRDIISIANGYTVERPDLALISDLIAASNKVVEAISDEEKREKMTPQDWYDLAKNHVGAICNFMGAPAANIIRDVEGAIRFIGDLTDDIYPAEMKESFKRGFSGNEEPKRETLYEAIVADDTGRINVLKKSYVDEDGKFNESAYSSAIRKALREYDPRIREAAQAYFDSDLDRYNEIFDDIFHEDHFEHNDIHAAIMSEVGELEKKNAPEEVEEEEKRPLYSAESYFNALLAGNKKSANLAYERLVEAELDEGYLSYEAENNVKSALASQIGSAYKDGKINRETALKLLKENTDKDETDVKKWDFEIKFGYPWSGRDRAYRKGVISESKLVNAIMDIEGESQEAARAYIKFIELAADHSDLEITADDAAD